MGLHIYCIVPAGHPIPADCLGLDDRRPVAEDAGILALWATPHDASIVPSVAALRTHNDVVRAAMTSHITPVPLRFGQWFASRVDAVERVVEDSGKWAALLARFAGRAEYGVRVLHAGPEAERDVHPEAPKSGKDYMAGLARKQAQTTSRREDGQRIASGLTVRLEGLTVDERVEYSPAGEVLVTLAHLVAWEAADAYHGVIREFCDAAQDVQFVVTGPWPPYSFVE
jgi:hypothetical protein